LMANERVSAAAQASSAMFSVYGDAFGAGRVRLYGVAEFADGKIARSDFITFNVNFNSSGPTSGPAPVAYGFIKDVPGNQPFILELPASVSRSPVLTTYTITQPPAQATLSGTGRTRLVRPNAAASGQDTLQYSVNDGSATSNTATITLRYTCPPIIISEQPQSRGACAGSGVRIAPLLAGPGPYTYQWRKNNTDVPGQTGAALTISSVAVGDAGDYMVAITSPCQTVVSAAATLTVQSAPSIMTQPVAQ